MAAKRKAAKPRRRLTKLGAGRASFRWDKRREEAAFDVAVDELTDDAIAAKAGVSRQALVAWKAHPDFAARVESHLAEIRARVRRHGIAVVENRVLAQQRRWLALQQVIAERAADPSMQGVPGGSTGLLVRQAKLVKVYEAGEPEDRPAEGESEAGPLTPTRQTVLVEEFAVDTGTLAALLAVERQASQELGQWAEKHEHSGPGGGPIAVAAAPDLTKLSADDLERLGQIAQRLADGGPPGGPPGGPGGAVPA